MSKKKHEMSNLVLRQIDEESDGGFILFYIAKDGVPKICSNYDSAVHASAMNYFVQNWAKAVEAYNVESIVNYLTPETDDESDEGDEGDEGDEYKDS